MRVARSGKATMTCHQQQETNETIQNPTHIGELLIRRLNNANREDAVQDGEADSLEDCVELECLRVDTPRSQGPSQEVDSKRFAHRIVLTACSAYFRDKLHGGGQTQCLKVDTNLETLDLILEYIYTNRSVELNETNCVHLFAAARTLGLDEMAKQAKRFIISKIGDLAENPNFLLKCPLTDMRSLLEVFQDLYFEESTKLNLVRRLYLWHSSLDHDTGSDSDRSQLFAMLTGLVFTRTRVICCQ